MGMSKKRCTKVIDELLESEESKPSGLSEDAAFDQWWNDFSDSECIDKLLGYAATDITDKTVVPKRWLIRLSRLALNQMLRNRRDEKARIEIEGSLEDDWATPSAESAEPDVDGHTLMPHTEKSLQEKLDAAIACEDYETAAELHKQIESEE